MPSPSSNLKGDALEDAVHAIESAILQSAPGLAEGSFTIKGKKTVTAGGVHHEIDVLVTASIAPGYESTFIFECKNWKDKVGKNELIIFSEKVDAVQAQRGFFVASRFTRDAKAQAAKNPRIQLLTSNYYEPVTRLRFPQLRLQFAGATHANVTLLGSTNATASDLKQIDLNEKIIIVDGQSFDATNFVQQKIALIRDAHLNALDLASLYEGTQIVQFKDSVSFAEGAATINSKPIRRIDVDGTTELTVAIGSVISVFEVQTRGRKLIVGATAGGIEMKAELVEFSHPQSTPL